MSSDARIEAWKESYRLANNGAEPPPVVPAGRGWWRIGDSRACYRAKDFVRFRANLRGEKPNAEHDGDNDAP